MFLGDLIGVWSPQLYSILQLAFSLRVALKRAVTLEGQFCNLGSHRGRSQLSKTEVEEFATVVGIYRFCAFFT